MKLIDQYRGLRKEIYILVFGRMVTALGSMVWPIMTMILNQKMGLTASEISFYFVAVSLISLPSNLIGGKLADRVNKKRLIVICDGISIICFVICALIPLSMMSLSLFILAGIIQGLENPAYEALVADLSTTKEREKAFSLSYLGWNLGMVLSPTLAGILFQDHLWLCFLISGVSVGISTLLIGLKIRDITPVEDTDDAAVYQEKKEGIGLFRILKENPMLFLYLLCATLFASAYNQYTFIMPLDMSAVHGDSGALIYGTVSSLNCIVVVLFTPLITKLFAKLRDTGKMLTSRLLVFAGYMVFLLLPGFIPGYYMAMLVFTWGEIFDSISAEPYITVRIPASHRGRINGFMSVAYTLVCGGFDLAVGHLYDRTGSGSAWALILGITLVSAVLTVVLKVRDKKAYPKLYQSGAENKGDNGAEKPKI